MGACFPSARSFVSKKARCFSARYSTRKRTRTATWARKPGGQRWIAARAASRISQDDGRIPAEEASMPAYVCVTCGTQFPGSAASPDKCPICTDERQFVPRSGQAWTTLDAMRWIYRNSFRQYEPALLGVGTIPEFGIRQRALLLRAPAGNVLWDCITFIDDATVSVIEALGGISAIAISHPHYYGTMVECSHAFGTAPIYLHQCDRQWVMRPDPAIHFWSGDRLELSADLTLINAGGHFEGGTVMHWRSGAAGRGALLAGDILQVVPDFRW